MPRGACARAPPSTKRTRSSTIDFLSIALIHRFKFAGDLAMGRWLGDELAAAVRGFPPPAWIVAPPLTAARLRERGFNQALELAKVVARATGARLEFAAVAKLRETAAQAVPRPAGAAAQPARRIRVPAAP